MLSPAQVPNIILLPQIVLLLSLAATATYFWNILCPIKYAKQSWSIERPLSNGNLQRVATSLQAFRKFRLSRIRFPFQGQHSNIVFTVVIAPGLSYMSVSQYQCLPYWMWIYCQGLHPLHIDTWDYQCWLLSRFDGNCTYFGHNAFIMFLPLPVIASCHLMRHRFNWKSKGYQFLKAMVYASSLSSAVLLYVANAQALLWCRNMLYFQIFTQCKAFLKPYLCQPN